MTGKKAPRDGISPEDFRSASPNIDRISRRKETKMPAEQNISRDSYIRHLDDTGEKRQMPETYEAWARDPQPAPHKTYVETALDYLSDVKVSDKVRRESEQQRMDEQALYTLNNPNSSEEEKAQAREYLDARNEMILRQNEDDRRRRGIVESAKKAGKGLMNTMGGVGHVIKSEFAEAQRRPTGDIDVSAYDYTRNGKRVHVDAHKRKRS
jgi:hypothetical protein